MSHEFIAVNHVSKAFAGVQALEDVSVTIHSGEIRCLVGENGSGKSTLIKVISGVYGPNSGEILIHGRSYKRLHPIESIRQGIQIIYQDFSLFPNLTVAENLAINYELEKNTRVVNWREVNAIARKAIENINIDIDLQAYVEDLSVADKQLVAISRAILHDAKLIVMDEPTTALTQNEVESLFHVITSQIQSYLSVIVFG